MSNARMLLHQDTLQGFGWMDGGWMDGDSGWMGGWMDGLSAFTIYIYGCVCMCVCVCLCMIWLCIIDPWMIHRAIYEWMIHL